MNHSMSDSSEDEICLPSLRDKILTSVSNSKSISSSETITSMKQKLSSENKSDKTALSHQTQTACTVKFSHLIDIQVH